VPRRLSGLTRRPAAERNARALRPHRHPGWLASEYPAGFDRNRRLVCVGMGGWLRRNPHTTDRSAREMAKRRDCFAAICRRLRFCPALGLRRARRQAPGFGDDRGRYRLTSFAVTLHCAIANALQLRDQAGFLELRHGAQDLPHQLGGWHRVGEVTGRLDGISSMPRMRSSAYSVLNSVEKIE
jgi:hypothetical protein